MSGKQCGNGAGPARWLLGLSRRKVWQPVLLHLPNHWGLYSLTRGALPIGDGKHMWCTPADMLEMVHFGASRAAFSLL
jgi:hypothetical protein